MLRGNPIMMRVQMIHRINVFYYYDHIGDVTQKIKSVSPQEPRDHSRTDDPTVPVHVKAGELIGYAR